MSKGDGAILHGDSLEVLKDLPDNSVDAIVTDPPYGLSFMGKKWDYDVPSVELWKECLRVLKPGGHVLSFCGTRTYHRMVVNMEDAGFEIRDQLQWIYGSGFPKSQDVSKAIDKQAGAERTVVGMNYVGGGGASNSKGFKDGSGGSMQQSSDGKSGIAITAPATDAAKQWQGWGTALKPANEPICLARKPLEAKLTVAANVLKHGTGAINVDASRIEGQAEIPFGKQIGTESKNGNGKTHGLMARTEFIPHAQGRWPANVLFDEEAAAVLDEQTQQLHGAGAARKAKRQCGDTESLFGMAGGDGHRFGDSGGASRFFYVAKASKRERNAGLQGVITWENVDQDLQDLMALVSQQLKAISDTSIRHLGDDAWSTSLFGKNIMGLSLKDIKSTTSTVLSMTIELKTLNASAPSNIKESIRDVLKTTLASGLNLAESVELLSQLKASTTSAETGSALGAVNAVLTTLSKIKDLGKQGNVHSTVKPVKLMEYLVRMITPPGGVVLDPFTGSGTTGVATVNLGFTFIGVEREAEYVKIAETRLQYAMHGAEVDNNNETDDNDEEDVA